MATITIKILPKRLKKDGTTSVLISVAHNGATRYIPTPISVMPTQWRSGVIVNHPLASVMNNQLTQLLLKYQQKLIAIDYPQVLSCAELVQALQGTDIVGMPTLADVHRHYIQHSLAKKSTLHTYDTMFAGLTKRISADTRLVSINHTMLVQLQKKLNDENISPTYHHYVISYLRTLYRHALKHGMMSAPSVDVFADIQLPQARVRDNWLTLEQLRTIRDFPFKAKFETTRNIFMLSFYLGGMNLCDILKLDVKKAIAGTIKYERMKTDRQYKVNKFVEFKTPQEAVAILKIPAVQKALAGGEYTRRNQMQQIKYMIPYIGFDFTFYSARKTFAQTAFNIGINNSVIDYVLGHSLGAQKNILYSYVAVTPAMATDCIRRVIDEAEKKVP